MSSLFYVSCRLDYDSPEEELCSCGASSNVYLNDFSKVGSAFYMNRVLFIELFFNPITRSK